MDRLSAKSTSASDAPTPIQMPAGRLGALEDMGNVAVFLLSGTAVFVTGQVLVVDGGSDHLRTTQPPCPQAVLDLGSVEGMIKPRGPRL